MCGADSNLHLLLLTDTQAYKLVCVQSAVSCLSLFIGAVNVDALGL